MDAGFAEPQHGLFVNISVDLLILTTSTEKSNLHKEAQRRLIREHITNFSSQFLADMRPSARDQQNAGRDILLLFSYCHCCTMTLAQ